MGASPVGLVLLLWLSACTGHNYAPVEDLERPKSVTSGVHKVAAGDTLYSIAWRYGRDYRELAQVNNIRPPYLIKPGQRISLGKPATVANSGAASTARATTNSANASNSGAARQRVRVPAVNEALSPSANNAVINWRWPATGRILKTFDGANSMGIDIKAEEGRPVMAAADGEIVYAGGLVGYGNLVIIKHNDDFLSAYGHNRRILVAEHKKVKAGEKVAEIGSTGVKESMLHFEIRKLGKPVDPLIYLPKLSGAR